jgi:hypothetical protein
MQKTRRGKSFQVNSIMEGNGCVEQNKNNAKNLFDNCSTKQSTSTAYCK